MWVKISKTQIASPLKKTKLFIVKYIAFKI